MSGLGAALDRVARAPVLLVASDFDGTLAPIVPDPADARPLPEAVAALRILAALPATHVAVVSGRALRDLAALIGASEGLHLVGSHGSEFEPGFARALPTRALRLRERIEAELAKIAAGMPGVRLEPKPASVAFHYRGVAEARAAEALRAIAEGPGALDGVRTLHGKKVVELGVLSTDKGTAVTVLRERVGASAVCFVGDDVTDEDGFAVLGPADLGVKVGEGPSRAPLRVPDPAAVAGLFARLAERRAAWSRGA